MRIVDRRKSLETCTESGWDAFDLLTEEPLSPSDIEGLRETEGSFLYMRQLKKPFFKVESHTHVLKGVEGDTFFRYALHRDSMDELEAFLKKYT